ncbi:hypothetical protein [Planktothrix agardhii]|uniref:hypothetical protein n=1 Tax=Planktothrix agardhii TaxID=1160 RepID=UPI001F25B622|nr:hypothetical protein [Planktothrix agardhii]MCF3646221.1 hypothetical protein [Planktothrix agardhii 1026]CAD5950372.1 hypothetical protein NO2A_02972 [Planktothrix agardhii]
MKELEVYVISSALGKTGIHWRKVESSQSVLGYPDMLEKRLVKKKNGDLGTIEYRINYQKLSFVIMRHSQQLLFLVAGIEALEERSNQLGSTIYNAVAWVANPDESNSISPENELMLRHLAARALLSFVGKDKDPEFINTINEAINFKGLEEFEVNLNKINQLTENSADKLEQLLPNLDKAEGDQQIWYKKVEKTSNEQEIISLAEKIINTGLPEDDLAILISKVDEKNAVSVLSIDLKPEISTDNQVQKVTTSLENIVENQEVVKNTPGKERKQILLLMVLIVSLLMIILFSLKTMENQKEKPEKIPIPQTLINPWPSSPVTLTNTKI